MASDCSNSPCADIFFSLHNSGQNPVPATNFVCWHRAQTIEHRWTRWKIACVPGMCASWCYIPYGKWVQQFPLRRHCCFYYTTQAKTQHVAVIVDQNGYGYLPRILLTAVIMSCSDIFVRRHIWSSWATARLRHTIPITMGQRSNKLQSTWLLGMWSHATYLPAMDRHPPA